MIGNSSTRFEKKVKSLSKMKIAVLGGGMVGSLIATQLSKKYELVVYDNTKLKLKNIKTIVNDVTDKNFPNKLKNYNLGR